MALTAPAVSGIDLEGTSLALWAEFLGGYFNGAPHAIGGTPNVPFTTAEVRFQERPQTQPLKGIGIKMVWVAPSKIEKTWDVVGGVPQEVIYAAVSWLCIVRAQVETTNVGNAQTLCAKTAGLLFALVQNSKATQPLAQKGIHHLRPGTPQAVIEGKGGATEDVGFVLRMISVRGQLRYPVLSNPPV